MRFRDGRFTPSGFAEYAKLTLTFLSAASQVGLDIALSVLIGSGFRARAPWALFLAISLAAAWALGLLLLLGSFVRLVRYLNTHHTALKDSRSFLVLPLGAESLAATLGSVFFSAAVVWITKTARDDPRDYSDAARFSQFDVYFPIAIGFQILALPGCVRLADIFTYAEVKATREVDAAPARADKAKRKEDTMSVTSHGSLISAESIRAAQKELDLARARLERQAAQERALGSVSTGGESAQSIGPQMRQHHSRPLVPMTDLRKSAPERDRREPAAEGAPSNTSSFWRRREPEQRRQRPSLRSGESVEADDTRITIFSDVPTKR